MNRQFVDSFGFSWQVWEIEATAGADGSRKDNPTASPAWLYFFSRGITRRLGSYPADWDARSWIDLEEMCMRAEVLGAERSTRLVRRLTVAPSAATL